MLGEFRQSSAKKVSSWLRDFPAVFCREMLLTYTTSTLFLTIRVTEALVGFQRIWDGFRVQSITV